ncbi:uncharacterized protein C14orf119 isoform X2 [Aricia agestis]|nr:uncharacterized protein C14orf119 isoform X2 [Aricia agestis]
MSNSGLTSEAQMRYILQWFQEFSELQREDFLPVLAAARSNQPEQLAAILSSLSCEDKPASLFQCRIKLFNEWYPTWTEEEQDRVVKGVSEMDSDFATKLQDALQNGIKVNGHDDFFHEIISQENKTDDKEEEAVVENVIPDAQVESAALQTECVM